MGYEAHETKKVAMVNTQATGLGSAGGIYTDVWTPATGKRIVLAGFILNPPEEMTVEFFEKTNSTRVSLFKMVGLAAGAKVLQFPGEIILPIDHILEVHVSATTRNLGINAFGHEES